MPVDLERKADAFSRLGKILKSLCTGMVPAWTVDKVTHERCNLLPDLVDNLYLSNPWFTPDFVRNSLLAVAFSLEEEKLRKWTAMYRERILTARPVKNIAVIMAGNLPMVGFHDFFCVLMSGNRLICKLSSEDNRLLPAVAGILTALEPAMSEYIEFAEMKMSGFDAVIATGSSNTSRYFDYYFGKYPHIIRKSRTSVALLEGNESREELEGLADDLLLYFGQGCRNVSKLLVPEGFDLNKVLHACRKYEWMSRHNKYLNNYDFNKSIYLINRVPHLDSGYLMLTEHPGLASPVSVVYYQTYRDLAEVGSYLAENKENIQCVVSRTKGIGATVGFGSSQFPELWDYADGVDTMEFLLRLE